MMKHQLKHPIGWLSLSLIIPLGLTPGLHTDAQSFDSTVFQLVENISPSTQNISADKLFRNAYEKRYTWDSQFPGYTAVVDVKQDNQTYSGRIRVNPDLKVVVTGIENKDARETVEYRLRMLNVHRQRVPFDVAHKNSTFKLGTKDKTGAVEIVEQGETNASYRLANEQIIQVKRSIGPHAFTVDTLAFQNTPEGYLATRYRATAFQPQTKEVLGGELSEDTYQKIGKYYLPTRQVIQSTESGEQYNVEINLSDLEVLSASK